MSYADALIAVLSVLTGAVGGNLLTISYYHRIANERATRERELSRAQDVLAGLALLRRTHTRHQHWLCPPED
jgi:hypothetical protein